MRNYLPPRENEIMSEVSNGLSNKKLAGKFGISKETVKTHLSNILRLLGARNRTHAVAIWILNKNELTYEPK